MIAVLTGFTATDETTFATIPEKVVTNHDLEKMVETSDEWITERTGIKVRHVAGENETTCDLAEAGACASSDPSGFHAAQIKVEQARNAGLADAGSLDFQEAERHLGEASRMLEENEDQKPRGSFHRCLLAGR